MLKHLSTVIKKEEIRKRLLLDAAWVLTDVEKYCKKICFTYCILSQDLCLFSSLDLFSTFFLLRFLLFCCFSSDSFCSCPAHFLLFSLPRCGHFSLSSFRLNSVFSCLSSHLISHVLSFLLSILFAPQCFVYCDPLSSVTTFSCQQLEIVVIKVFTFESPCSSQLQTWYFNHINGVKNTVLDDENFTIEMWKHESKI